MANRHLIIVVVALVLATGLAHAAILPFGGNVNFSSVGTTNLGITQFNPAWGTLTGVTVYTYGTGQATFAADNDFEVGITATATMNHSFDVTASGVTTHGSDTWTDTQVLSADNGDGSAFDPTGPDGHNWGTQIQGEYATSPASVVVPVGNWAAYIGTGTANFHIASNTFTSDITGSAPWYGPGGTLGGADDYLFVDSVTNPNLNVRVEVDYTYTPNSPDVPEPCTLALLGLGLFGMGVRARRKKTQAAA